MIANVDYNKGGTKGISKYVRYLLSPKRDASIENSSNTERVVAFECSMSGPKPSTKKEIREAVQSITDSIIAHNLHYKKGRKFTNGKHALMGEVSFALEDSHLTPAEAMRIVKENLNNTMGGSREYVMVCHEDSACLHVHFVVSTVDAITGKQYDPGHVKQPDGKQYQRQMFDDWEIEMDRAELAYGLKQVDQRRGVARLEERNALAEGKEVISTRRVKVAQPKHIAVSKYKRLEESDELTLHYRVQKIHAQTLGDLDLFLDTLEAHNITPVISGGNDDVRGITFVLNDTKEKVAGSKLGDAFGWPTLQKEMNYDYATHIERLQGLNPRLTRSRTQELGTASLGNPSAGLVSTDTSIDSATTISTSTSGFDPLTNGHTEATEPDLRVVGRVEQDGKEVATGTDGRALGSVSTVNRESLTPASNDEHQTGGDGSKDAGTRRHQLHREPTNSTDNQAGRKVAGLEHTTDRHHKKDAVHGISEGNGHGRNVDVSNSGSNGSINGIGGGVLHLVETHRRLSDYVSSGHNNTVQDVQTAGHTASPTVSTAPIAKLLGDPPLTEEGEALITPRMTDKEVITKAWNSGPTNPFWPESTEEKTERLTGEIKKMLEEETGLIPAPSTINGPHKESIDYRAKRLAVEAILANSLIIE